MNQLRIPGSAQRRANGSAYIDSLHLNVTCNAVCDVCGRSRNKGSHQKCSKLRKLMNARHD